MDDKSLTFWEHLDELRSVIVRIVACLFILSIVMFFFKDWLFGLVLAPAHNDFILYKLIDSLAAIGNAQVDDFQSQLINTELTGQFMVHMQVAFYAAIIIGSPYILSQIFSYVAPALYANERKMLGIAITAGSVLFYIGVVLSYILIFPLSFRFLVMYQISTEVTNMIQLTSYIDTMMLLCLMMGILFELPLISILLAKFGFISARLMSQYRRHAVLAILVVAAIITPTTDIFTLVIVSLPIYILYEGSIICVRLLSKSSKN